MIKKVLKVSNFEYIGGTKNRVKILTEPTKTLFQYNGLLCETTGAFLITVNNVKNIDVVPENIVMDGWKVMVGSTNHDLVTLIYKPTYKIGRTEEQILSMIQAQKYLPVCRKTEKNTADLFFDFMIDSVDKSLWLCG